MIFLDTGYFIALLRPRDELHARALAWSRAVRERLLLTEYVLLETLNHFSALVDRPAARALLVRVEAESKYELVRADPRVWSAGVALHRQRTDKEWSLTDCISFAIMRERGITRALAYDHHFEQAGFEVLLRRDPP